MKVRLRGLIHPTGRHRRPIVTPIEPTVHGVLDEADLAALIAAGDIEPNDWAYCGRCRRYTLQRTTSAGTRACWHCKPFKTTPGE